MFFVARVPKKTGLKFAPKRWCSEATPQKKAEAGSGLVNFTLATPNNTYFRDQDVDSISLPGLGIAAKSKTNFIHCSLTFF